MSRKNRNDRFGDGKKLNRTSRKLIVQDRASSFRCVHCKTDVPTDAAGTAHRNHCPLCLWSRHVDEAIGDRKSECLSSMRPIGLTIKNNGGELMVVHMCLKCDKVSKNRIAADDNTYVLFSLFQESLNVSSDDRKVLRSEGVELCDNETEIKRMLYGSI